MYATVDHAPAKLLIRPFAIRMISTYMYDAISTRLSPVPCLARYDRYLDRHQANGAKDDKD